MSADTRVEEVEERRIIQERVSRILSHRYSVVCHTRAIPWMRVLLQPHEQYAVRVVVYCVAPCVSSPATTTASCRVVEGYRHSS
jgi:hypothetical protein